MAGTRLTPERITSPFQLMAAWFSMLVLITSVLLTAAANISKPVWAAGYLVIFASVVVVTIIGCVTLMLTLFRPHLQDGKEYSQWLRDKHTYSPGTLVIEDKTKTPSPRREKANRALVARSAKRNRCFVNVINIDGADELVNELRRSGFSSQIYSEPHSSLGLPQHRPSDQEAIWVGAQVPLEDAQESIRISLNKWPHLKYLEISTDNGDPPDEVHYEVFVGGASATAHRSGLEEWSRSELISLSNLSSLEEFHAAIRSKYS